MLNQPTASPLRCRCVRWTTALVVISSLAGCNVIDAMRGRPVRIVKMVPGANVATGGLDCWLTLEFTAYPPGADPTDISVRFRSIALEETQEFDWAYIADRDVRTAGGKFGSGHADAPATRADAPPPLDESIRIRFPLEARTQIEGAPSTLWLEAEVLWGGQRMDAERRTIEHVYSRSGNDYF